jgi:23S rRNA pseudouridine1911/1915/1917 synthase
MAIARNQAAFDFLSHAFAERQVGKLYLAFVSGQIQGSGQIDAPIGRHPTLRHKMAAGVRDGRKSRSLYRVICKFPRTGLSLVSVTLLTGRTHQARVHLSSIGAPVLADPCYGKGLGPLAKSHPSLAPLLTRQFLHARRLAIPHPSGDTMTFRAPWPQDFLRLLEELRRLERETK